LSSQQHVITLSPGYDKATGESVGPIAQAAQKLTTGYQELAANLKEEIENRNTLERAVAEAREEKAVSVVQQTVSHVASSAAVVHELKRAPRFTQLLSDAVLEEGSRFVFECR
jgi:hypothetical protein